MSNSGSNSNGGANSNEAKSDSASSGSNAPSAPSTGQSSQSAAASTTSASKSTAAKNTSPTQRTAKSATPSAVKQTVPSQGPKKLTPGVSAEANPGLFPEKRPSEIEEAPSDYEHIFHEPTNAPMPNATGLTGGSVPVPKQDAVPAAPIGPTKSPPPPKQQPPSKSPPMKRIFPPKKSLTPMQPKVKLPPPSPKKSSPTKAGKPAIPKSPSRNPVIQNKSSTKSPPSKNPVKIGGPKPSSPKVAPSFEKVMGRPIVFPSSNKRRNKSPSKVNKPQSPILPSVPTSPVIKQPTNQVINKSVAIPKPSRESTASVISAASKVGKDGQTVREKQLKQALDVATDPQATTVTGAGFDQAQYLAIIASGRVKYVDPWTGEVVLPRAAPVPNRYARK